MSLDLLKEFGPSTPDLLENPWSSALAPLEDKSPDDEDDFGDFEVPSNPNPPKSLNEPVHSSLKLTKLHSTLDETPTLQEALPKISADPISHEDDGWGNFMEGFNNFSLHPNGAISNDNDENQTFGSSESSVDIIHSTSSPQVDPTQLKSPLSNILEGNIAVHQNPPPSNVPPPSVLLLLIATLFQSLTTDLKKIFPLIEPSISSQTQTSTNQSSVDKFLTHLAVIRAAARIIAGRKLRWRRDNHLSQRMKIGPAHGGKAGGMKLAGIDRTEHRREDRDAEEAMRIWKQQLGGLRTIIAVINNRHPSFNSTLPEILEIMPVRQAKLSDGAIYAPIFCFLCGIKRDERVEKIDTDVEDSFGEWWVDHWGHVDCVIFWKNQESFLQQRR